MRKISSFVFLLRHCAPQTSSCFYLLQHARNKISSCVYLLWHCVLEICVSTTNFIDRLQQHCAQQILLRIPSTAMRATKCMVYPPFATLHATNPHRMFAFYNIARYMFYHADLDTLYIIAHNQFKWCLPSATLHAIVFQTTTNCMFLPQSVPFSSAFHWNKRFFNHNW